MRELIANFPDQLREAIEIGKSTNLNISNQQINNVLICGMGGSGISGSILSSLLFEEITVPMQVNNRYEIPKWVNKNTLVILASYSGNTEEVISSYEQVQKTGAEIAIISSGGKLLKIAKENNLNHFEIPGGHPPRACLGYSIIQYFFIFDAYQLLTNQQVSSLPGIADFLASKSELARLEAENITPHLLNTVAILFSSPQYHPINVRFKQQINENGKELAYTNVVPELTHNEIVGWTRKHDGLSVVLIKDQDDHPRIQARFDYIKELVSPYVNNYIEVTPVGSSLVEKAIYLIHLFDWVSLQMAVAKGIDPVEVDAITNLKEQLASLD